MSANFRIHESPAAKLIRELKQAEKMDAFVHRNDPMGSPKAGGVLAGDDAFVPDGRPAPHRPGDRDSD